MQNGCLRRRASKGSPANWMRSLHFGRDDRWRGRDDRWRGLDYRGVALDELCSKLINLIDAKQPFTAPYSNYLYMTIATQVNNSVG